MLCIMYNYCYIATTIVLLIVVVVHSRSTYYVAIGSRNNRRKYTMRLATLRSRALSPNLYIRGHPPTLPAPSPPVLFSLAK